MHVDKVSLQQSKHAVHRGEDQAMQQSLAAANAAAGERVQDSLATRCSDDNTHTAADPKLGSLGSETNQQAALGLKEPPGCTEAALPALSSQREAEAADPPALCKSCWPCIPCAHLNMPLSLLPCTDPSYKLQ